MAIKDLITPGIGFTPGSIKFILTRGLGIGAAIAANPPFDVQRQHVFTAGGKAASVWESGARSRQVWTAGGKAAAAVD